MTDRDTADHMKKVARTMAVALGLTDAFDELIVAMENRNVQALDAILDRLVPSISGFGATFLPSFALGATEGLMRPRDSWRRLRDRVFANMDECKRLIAGLPREERERIAATLVEWDRNNARFSREMDNDPLPN